MIIRTSVPLIEDIKKPVVKEEVKKEEYIPKKKNNKKSNPVPAPAVEKIPVVVEEEEKIDLGEWLKDNIEE